MAEVFLSYAHVDAAAMATVRAALHRGGLAVWTDEHLVRLRPRRNLYVAPEIGLSAPSGGKPHAAGRSQTFWWPEGGCPSKEELQGLLDAVAAFVRG